MAQHGRYKIQRRVADGGMAEIFLATQLGRDGFQKPVILKRIHSSIYADPQFRNMFIDEAHISMSLSHSNIVQVLDLGASAGRYFLVLELVDGWDLGRVLHRAAASGVRAAARAGRCTSPPRSAARWPMRTRKTDGQRPLGIVHRDVSPHNVLLSEQGEVKLTDFGIAKAMNKREHTGVGVVKGKVAFMSPEQAHGQADRRAVGPVLAGDGPLLAGHAHAPVRGAERAGDVAARAKGRLPAARGRRARSRSRRSRRWSRARCSPTRTCATRPPTRCWPTSSGCCARVFHPVGQSELKKWLTDLGARDGVPAISHSSARASAAQGGNELDEQDVVLLDTDADVVDGQERTSLAVVNGGGGASVTARPRVSRSRVTTPDLPVPEDAETMSERAGPGELALPVPDDERPPDRRRRRGGSGVSVLFVGGLLVAGAWFGGKYARVLLHMGGAEPATGGASTSAARRRAGPRSRRPPDQAAPRETTRSSESARARDAAKAKEAQNQAHDDGVAAAKRAEAAAVDAAAAADDTAPAARHGSDTPPPTSPAREPSPRRRPGDRPIDFVGRDIANLKDKMAPDPSLLPPPAETPPPAPAPTPPPASPDNP